MALRESSVSKGMNTPGRRRNPDPRVWGGALSGAIRTMIGAGLLALVGAGCSHPPPHQTVINFDAQLSRRLGRAKKADILVLMGEATAQDQIGEHEVWTYLYSSSGDKHRSKPELDQVAPQHDGLILEFDQEGTLQRYHVILEGRTTRRDRGRDR